MNASLQAANIFVYTHILITVLFHSAFDVYSREACAFMATFIRVVYAYTFN